MRAECQPCTLPFQYCDEIHGNEDWLESLGPVHAVLLHTLPKMNSPSVVPSACADDHESYKRDNPHYSRQDETQTNMNPNTESLPLARDCSGFYHLFHEVEPVHCFHSE